jgi:hypothetical protein
VNETGHSRATGSWRVNNDQLCKTLPGASTPVTKIGEPAIALSCTFRMSRLWRPFFDQQPRNKTGGQRGTSRYGQNPDPGVQCYPV